jgi:energy-converting hydrogenase Eha subunit H
MVLCGAALLFAMRLAGPTPGFRGFIATIPLFALVAIVAALIYVLANFFLLVPVTGAGVPVLTDGRYFFNDHGTMREVGEGAFHAQRATTLRLYSGVWLYLCLISAVLFLLARRPVGT